MHRVQPGSPVFPPWVYDAGTFIVQNPNGLFWEDTLRLGGYAKNPNVFDCPSTRFMASKNIGGSVSTNHTLGIAYNYPEYAQCWTSQNSSPGVIRETSITSPSASIVFADGGAVTTATIKLGADNWVPDIEWDASTMQYEGGGVSYFRVPSDPGGFASGDSRSLPRPEGNAEVVVREGVTWFESDDFLVLADRIVHLPLFAEGIAVGPADRLILLRDFERMPE